MKVFWEKHWDKIISIILTNALTAIATFYITIMHVNDKIEKANELSHIQIIETNDKFNNKISALKENFHKELANVRSEYDRDRNRTSSHISKIELGLTKVEECVFGYLKPYTADIVPLKAQFEVLRNDIDSLREKYSRDMKIEASLTSLDSSFRKLTQTVTPFTEKKIASISDN